MPLDVATPLPALADRAASAFAERFGRPPTVIAAAPGRVNIIGEHTDYNGGFVLPMAIDRYTVVAADRGAEAQSRIASVTMDSETAFTPAGEPVGEQPGWGKYVAAVLGVYADEGMTAPAMDAVIDSTVPLGGGLSSSASLEVSVATAIEALGGDRVESPRKALLCQRAEHRAGTPCGIMDQFSSALCQEDHLLLLDCRDESYRMQPFDDPSVAVLISNTNVKHELTGGEYAERRRECEQAAETLGVETLRDATIEQVLAAEMPDPVMRRARHIVTEIARTEEAAAALGERRWADAGRLMYGSHASLRDDFEVSCPELDALVEAARAIGPEGGVHGARMTGGGFGGCTVSLVDAAAAEAVAAGMAERYTASTGLTATQFVTRPARGAHLIR